MIAIRDDVVMVPIFLLNLLLNLSRNTNRTNHLRLPIFADHCFLTAVGENTPECLPVENSGIRVTGLEVSLVAADDPLAPFGVLEAAVLDAAVAADDLVVETKIEVAGLATVPNDEGVALGRVFLGGLAGAIGGPPGILIGGIIGGVWLAFVWPKLTKSKALYLFCCCRKDS